MVETSQQITTSKLISIKYIKITKIFAKSKKVHEICILQFFSFKQTDISVLDLVIS